MSQVGKIKTYHDGSTYNIADIYDEKLTSYNILAGTSAKEILAVSFNTTTGADYFFDADALESETDARILLYQSATSVSILADTANTSKPITKIIPYLSNEHAATGYGCAYVSNSARWLVIGQPVGSYTATTATSSTPKTFALISPTKDSGGNDVLGILPSHEIEGWFFVDTSSIKQSNKSYMPRFLWSIPTTTSASSTSSVTHGNAYVPVPSYNLNTAGTPATFQMYGSNDSLTYVRELDPNFFNDPFHIRLQWFNNVDNPNYVYLCYVNDELLFYKKRPEGGEPSQYYYYYWDHIVLGARFGYSSTTKKYSFTTIYSGIHVSNFKVSLLSPVYQKITVPANIKIRHNSANCYVPLTSNKTNTTTPCLAVRHGSTNYYALK